MRPHSLAETRSKSYRRKAGIGTPRPPCRSRDFSAKHLNKSGFRCASSQVGGKGGGKDGGKGKAGKGGKAPSGPTSATESTSSA